MLIHIRPRLFCPFKEVKLVDLTSEELGVHLRGGFELKVGHPYRNKGYAVACSKNSRKALDGIFIETPGPIPEFTVVTRWSVKGDFVATHRVEYTILDTDFDTISDYKMFWYATHPSIGGWESRFPTIEAEGTPLQFEPYMEVVLREGEGVMTRERATELVIDASTGWISEMSQMFFLPTLQRERLVGSVRADGMLAPPIETAFQAKWS